jgi:hypothetical protein
MLEMFAMSSLHLSVLSASLLVLTAIACSPSDVPTSAGNSDLSASSSGSSGKPSSSGSTPAPPGSASTPGGSTSGGDPTDPQPTKADLGGPCAPLIGKWEATFDDGASASGDSIPFGQSVPFSGKMDFTLTHDDADLQDIVDFAGTATITAMDQTQTYQMSPTDKASGDTKDTKCIGGLHIKGITNVAGIGDLIFTMDGDFDGTDNPASKGHANFTIKTADDDGKGMTGTGTAHLVRQ